jgi:electron transfer flavoprotein alpha subunit
MSDCGSCSNGSCSANKGDGDLPPGMLQQYNLNQSTAEGNVVWIETIKDDLGIKIADISLELIGKIRRMSDSRVFGIIIGDNDVKSLYDEIFSYGVDTLYHVKDKYLVTYHPEAYSDAIADVANRINPAMILIGGTTRGREVAPRVAAILSTGLTADCTELEMDGRKLLMTRPAFGGNIIATISCDTFPQMATVRPGIFSIPEPEIGRKGTVIYRQASCKCLKDIISSHHIETVESDISKAKILISLGKGIKKESIAIAESVALKIGGSVSCSRALVEKGWMPQNKQVGQSGRNVAPDIYIAFGISGSIQHKAGISSAKKIIAINSDPDAPIKDVCDEFIVGDANRILMELDRQLDS